MTASEISSVVAPTIGDAGAIASSGAANSPIGTSQKLATERLQGVKAKPPFEIVVRDHGPAVFRVCCAIVGAHDADDAWSETFLAALKSYPNLPADANLEAWLVTIAHHKAIDITRARTRRPVPTDVVPETPGPRDAGDFDELTAAVDQLPHKQKHAVAYHYLAGLPYDEVAGILGGTAAAARRAASDGIATLRRTYLGNLTEVHAPWKGDNHE
jgi:RNA polymerase sigma factor (sigma-70 family)